MKQWLSLAAWFLIYAVAMAVNLGPFWMGDSADVSRFGLSALYGFACLLVLWSAKSSKRWLRDCVAAGIVWVMAGTLCLLARTGMAWASIPAICTGGVLFTPFYGFSYLEFLGDWDTFYGGMLLTGVVWVVVSGWLLQKMRNDGTKQ